MNRTKYFLFCIILSLIISLTGCAKKQDKPTSEEESVAASGFAVKSQDVLDSMSKSRADDSGRNLLRLDTGTMLDYKEPELHTQIVAVVPNEEKTNYVVLTTCQIPYGNSWIWLQFFKADGTYIRSISFDGYFHEDWKNEYVSYTGDTFRLNSANSVLYYNLKTHEKLVVDGSLLSTDRGVDLILSRDRNGTCYLVQNYKIIDSMETSFTDMDYSGGENMPEKKYRLNAEKRIATFETKNIRYTLDFKAKTCGVERFYTGEDLRGLVGVSDDGKVEVYYACGGSAGDGWWNQVITKNKESGKYTFLTYVQCGEFAVLGGKDILIINYFGELELYNIKTNEKVDNFFDYNGKNILVGLYYDKAKQQYIFAYEKYTDDREINNLVSLYVLIIDSKGDVVKEIDPKLKVGKLIDGVAIRTVQITPNDDGSYTLDTGLGTENTTIKP